MELNKNKSSHPLQLIVKASERIERNHFSKKAKKAIGSFRRDLLPPPEQYYANELKRFTRRKAQGSALCPFHDDHSPSFTVNLKTGQFMCFACGVNGGDIVSFCMQRYSLIFIDACKALGVWHE